MRSPWFRDKLGQQCDRDTLKSSVLVKLKTGKQSAIFVIKELVVVQYQVILLNSEQWAENSNGVCVRTSEYPGI
ncbi:hypothetical protein [Nostoc linckia]|uniref:hypothetical protein n=1 Tax=Nostoc linckia TaxID=92942 RepID=UPI00117CA13C|nr:hypothetical protein [Nostoc linckia]